MSDQKICRRITQSGVSSTKIQWTGHDGGTQTQIHPSTGYESKTQEERKSAAGGSEDVRVIVQPIQPVFYMPHQGKVIY